MDDPLMKTYIQNPGKYDRISIHPDHLIELTLPPSDFPTAIAWEYDNDTRFTLHLERSQVRLVEDGRILRAQAQGDTYHSLVIIWEGLSVRIFIVHPEYNEVLQYTHPMEGTPRLCLLTFPHTAPGMTVTCWPRTFEVEQPSSPPLLSWPRHEPA